MDSGPPSANLTPRFSVTIDSRLELVAVVADLARIACDGLGMVNVYDVEIAIVEAVSNVISHAYEGEPGHAVHVRFAASSDWLQIEVTDAGRSLDPVRMRAARLPAANDVCDLPERGYGLGIIHRVMHKVRYETLEGRNVLTLLAPVLQAPHLARCV